jgi:hypothetical protein
VKEKLFGMARFLDVHLSGLVHFFFKIHEHLFLIDRTSIYKGGHYVDMFDYVQ